MKNDRKNINLNTKVLIYYLIKYTKYWKYGDKEKKEWKHRGEKGGPITNFGCDTLQAHHHSKIAAGVHSSTSVEKTTRVPMQIWVFQPFNIIFLTKKDQLNMSHPI